MADNDGPLGEVILRDVRLSFAHIFEPQEFRDDETGAVRRTFGANFLIDKEDDPYGNLKAVKAAAKAVREKKWGSKQPNLKPEKLCLRDGDHEDWDGYEGCFYLSTNSPESRPPSVVTNRKDKDGDWIEAVPGQQNAPYSGCYVNAIVRIWAQDAEPKKGGKRLNASVESVQYRRKGEAFGAAPADPNSKFTDDDVSDEGDDDSAYAGATEDDEEDDGLI